MICDLADGNQAALKFLMDALTAHSSWAYPKMKDFYNKIHHPYQPMGSEQPNRLYLISLYKSLSYRSTGCCDVH